MIMGLLSNNSYALTINNVTQSGDINCAFYSCETLNTEPVTENRAEKINPELTNSQDSKNIPILTILVVALGGSLVAFCFNQRKKFLKENANLRIRLENLEEIVTK
nr:hypothetical protein A5482_07610 [Cyanobacterium sp. IPPAS B-1200]